MTNVVQDNVRTEVDVRPCGFGLSVQERTVSECVCMACGEVETVDGIVEFLVFEYDHRHELVNGQLMPVEPLER